MTMLAHELVTLMSDLIPEGGQRLERLVGQSATDVAREIEAAIMVQLEGNLGHVLLWEQFQGTPGDVTQALVNVLNTLMQKDSTLAHWLAESLERYHEQAVSGDKG